MKIVVIGGTGLIGSRTVRRLRDRGHEVIIAALETNINVVTGDRLAEAVAGAQVVVDVANSPSLEEGPALAFFEASSHNLITAERAAHVQHHVTLSVVGTARLQQGGYFRAKALQERLIASSGIPFTIVHATQFFEFMSGIAEAATEGGVVRLPPVLFQPMAADEVADIMADVALSKPVNDIIEVAGPERVPMPAFVGRFLRARNDPRTTTIDPEARYYGARLTEDTLLPGDGARIGTVHFDDWLAEPRDQQATVSRRG